MGESLGLASTVSRDSEGKKRSLWDGKVKNEAERKDRQGSERKLRANQVPCLSIPGFCFIPKGVTSFPQNEQFYSCPF